MAKQKTNVRSKEATATQSRTVSKRISDKAEKQSAFVLHEFEKAAEIASYYGFVPMESPVVTPDDVRKTKRLNDARTSKPTKRTSSDMLCFCPQEKISILRTYLDRSLHNKPQPVLIYHKKPYKNHYRKSAPNEQHFNLEVIGTAKSVAEALLIRATLAILEEDGFKDVSVDINSVGDKESFTKFERELTAFFKRNIDLVPSAYQHILRKDVFELLRIQDPKCQELAMHAPQSINYLSESSRKHFKEVLEYLESLDIPYTINNNLVDDKDHSFQTIFQIREMSTDKDKQGTLLASGGRYSRFAKKIRVRKEVPALGVNVWYKPKHKNKPTTTKRVSALNTSNPKFYFVQFGFEAKLKSLHIIEALRKEKVPLCYCLTKDKLVGQLTTAENLKVPYVVIIGQKEAMDNTAVVRDQATRAQETVSLDDLPKYLKKIAK